MIIVIFQPDAEIFSKIPLRDSIDLIAISELRSCFQAMQKLNLDVYKYVCMSICMSICTIMKMHEYMHEYV